MFSYVLHKSTKILSYPCFTLKRLYLLHGFEVYYLSSHVLHESTKITIFKQFHYIWTSTDLCKKLQVLKLSYIVCRGPTDKKTKGINNWVSYIVWNDPDTKNHAYERSMSETGLNLSHCRYIWPLIFLVGKFSDL